MRFIKKFTDISLKDSALVGGKNASLGEMIQQLSSRAIPIPMGFAITAQAYNYYLEANKLQPKIHTELERLIGIADSKLVQQVSATIRDYIIKASFPLDLVEEIAKAYTNLSNYYHQDAVDVAVRSSATAEDLPQASFAGQLDTYLNIQSLPNVLNACKKSMASLFNERAIIYRTQQKFSHFDVAVSVGVQKMVRSDKACSGVLFTLDTESGFKDVIVIDSSYGLGETIVQGTVIPDEFHVHKPTLIQGFNSIIHKKLGTKNLKLVYATGQTNSTKLLPVSQEEQNKFSLTDNEILHLGHMGITIEEYYTRKNQRWSPMDIEWAKDGTDQQLYIVQARPETVHAQQRNPDQLQRYHLGVIPDKAQILVTGQSIGQKISSGKARIITNIEQNNTVINTGDILVTHMTNPQWVQVMRKASAIITDQGGRTCHAAIVSRELGIPAIVGTDHATSSIQEGQAITIDCSQGSTGYVYAGALPFTKETITITKLPKPPVTILLNIADPGSAYELSFLPVKGVGLARIEFIISNLIKVHPMAIVEFNKIHDAELKAHIKALAHPYGEPRTFYIDSLAQGIGTIAAAFYPRPVTVRFSDFKSNEYRNLLGGSLFEPHEENPMLGFRGAVRYCSNTYAPAFALECAALSKVRTDMGLTNVKIMIPFVRTVAEAKNALSLLAKHNLIRGENNLEIIMMCEVPANIIILEQFAPFFDGFSLGSNDLTQLILAVDRDSAFLSKLFDERDPAVLSYLLLALRKANDVKVPMSICGQAPSDFPEVADLLISHGIEALSLNPDSVIPFILRYQR